MKVNIDYKRKPEVEKETNNQALTADYINFAIRQFYKEGLDSQWRRTFARIQRKLDDAIDNKIEDVEFEQTEMDFIKRAFKEAKFPSDISKYIVLLEDELETKLTE